MHSILAITEPVPASSSDLVSLDDLKLALGITDNSQDAQLQAMITFQSRIITEYCVGPPPARFAFAQAVETFTFDPYENLRMREALTLSLYPVTDVTAVTVAGTATTDYHFDPSSGRLWLTDYLFPTYWQAYYPWGPWPGGIEVDYSGGYNLPDQAPVRLQKATIEAVNQERMAGNRDPTIREVQHGDTRISYVSPSFAAGAVGQYLTAAVTDLIKPYRRFYIA